MVTKFNINKILNINLSSWDKQYISTKSLIKENQHSTDNDINWEDINWNKVQKETTRLQEKIAEAALKGDYDLIMKLQNTLVNTLSARLLAVKRVSSSSGKKTAGIDKYLFNSKDSSPPTHVVSRGRGGIHPSRGPMGPRGEDLTIKEVNKRKMDMVFLLKDIRNYKALPVKRVGIPKANGKIRYLGIPTIKDRCMQALWAIALAPVAEIWADNHSFGFRFLLRRQNASEVKIIYISHIIYDWQQIKDLEEVNEMLYTIFMKV